MKYRFVHKSYLNLDELIDLYTAMETQRLTGAVFYDTISMDALSWVEYLEDQRCWLVRIENMIQETVGVFWLNGYMGRSAQIHFCVWRGQFKNSLDIGREGIEWLKKNKVVDSLYGVTPDSYTHVLKFLKKLGFQIKGKLPGACHLAHHKKYIPGVISVLDLNKE